jgi:two-component system cell cycle sensor histidine kinase/response regulator CckA
MAKPLRILFVEDSPNDRELEEHELRKGGLDFVSMCVESRDEYLRALREYKPSIILSDYSLPGLDGPEVLRMAQEACPDVPFIFVSGTIGEERAIESLKRGATDYVVKGRLGGLVVRAQRALKDVEERLRSKRLEEELRQAQKMEALGRLAGGVAHDFNNLLTAILGYGDLLLGRVGPDSPLRTDLQEVKRAGERAASLTRQLLAFSRRQPLRSKILDAREQIGFMEPLLRRLLPESIRLELAMGEAPLLIRVDPGQLDQVLLNLALNARDAMSAGNGVLRIGLAPVEMGDAALSKHPGVRPGHYIVLSVADTGAGIPQDMLPHLFEPFFTTKDEGKGTGLGLATVYGITRQSGGFLSVSSEPGRGTTFRIYFPEIREEKPDLASTSQVIEKISGTETILLVEDEEQVRRLVRHCLAGNGYTVIEARDPIDALKLVEKDGVHIDLLLTDIVMPAMNGRALAAELRRRLGDDLSVVYMSGYSEDATVREGKAEPWAGFIAKPFVPTDLLVRVRKTLTRHKAKG